MGPISFGFDVVPKDQTTKLIQQVHSNTLVEIQAPTTTCPIGDGVYTYRKHLPISVFTADCVPLLLYSGSPGTPIAAIHSGWRGTKQQIIPKAIQLFNGESVTAILGPAIGPCCFEVQDDLIKEFTDTGIDLQLFITHRGTRTYFDLVGFVCRIQLQGVRVVLDHFRCTVCSLPLLPSYRRNKSTDPQIRSWIIRND